MDALKIWFADFWPEWPQEDFVTPILSKHFDIKLDEDRPDVLFHSVFGGMQETPRYKCKKILYLGENKRSNEYGSNYSISFDLHSDTNFRLPLWQVYILLKSSLLDYTILKSPLLDRLYNRINMKEFSKWCAFVVSNPSNFIRNSLYMRLNEYKAVSSYGRAFPNDFSLQKLSEGRYWRDAKDEFFQKHSHKFMVAVENSPYKYYCTEKLMDAFLANTIPIYWGDTRIAEEWNERAFVNGTKIDIVEAVKKIDRDDGLFRAMYEEPIFTDEQKKKLENNLKSFEEWLINAVKV